MEIKRYDCGVRFATAVEYNGMVYTSGLVTSDRTGDITAQTKDVLSKIDAALEKAGFKYVSADHDKIPSTYVTLDSEDDIKYMTLLLEHLEGNDDVTEVYHNWDN